jgi:phospholipase/lecithinase/hemolysin
VAFQTEAPRPSPNALYTLSIGSNDVLDILASPGLTTQQQTTDVDDAVANEIAFVKQLVTDGAKNLLVLGVPDIGKAPNVMEGLANGSDTPSARSIPRPRSSPARTTRISAASSPRLPVPTRSTCM